MTNEELAAAIVSELTLAYMQAGSHISADNALLVAKSYCEDMDFRDLTEVHEAFSRSKTVADIPTKRTLSEALKNYRAENYTQTGAPALEYKDPRAAWLPADYKRRCLNMMTAIRNLSSAISDAEYSEYCKAHVRHKVGDRYEYVNVQKALEFDRPKKAMLQELYCKYWRNLPMAQGFPANAMLNHGLTPPTVPEFREMLRMEAERAAAEF
jgi:hypothetical protein